MGPSIGVFRDAVETLAYLAQIIAVGVLIYAASSYLLQRQQLNFDVITNCTERFQNILPALRFEEDSQREEAQKRYVDLCNEQVFYFANGYLPPDVIAEWLDGMVLYLPHRNGEEWCSAEQHSVRPELLRDYSRLQGILQVGRRYDTNCKEQREELVGEIHANVKKLAPRRRFPFGPLS